MAESAAAEILPFSSPIEPAPLRVTVHPYPSKNVKHACAYEHANDSFDLSPPKNALVFIGGLTDGPHTVPYIRTIAEEIKARRLAYSVFEIRIRSSFDGFGWGSLSQDVEDISAVVKYLRSIGKDKIVLMGHSTGCQDCMEYNKYDKYHNEPVDGFIMQGSVSDREAYATDVLAQSEVDDILALCKEMIDAGRGDDAVPKSKLPPNFPFSNPMTAYRLHSLSAVGGDDDYFSSDLAEDRVKEIWGSVKKPILIVPSALDEFVPKSVDFTKLLAKWKSHCPLASDLSGLIPGANHTVNNRLSKEWLAERVVSFLQELSGTQAPAL